MKLIAMTLASLSLLASATAQADPRKARDDVRAVAPALEKYKQDTLFGDLWKRSGLNPRDRSIVTLAALITRNQTADLPDYLNLGLENGVKPSEISEIITHLAFYAGWANAMAATAVAKDVFAARKITADQIAPASPNLLALNEAAEADRAKRVGDLFGAVFPGVVQYTTDVLFRDLWLRPGLAWRHVTGPSLQLARWWVRSGRSTDRSREHRHEQRTDAGRDRGGAHASRLLCRMAQRVLRDAGRQGRV
jgi:4-carboxymuconolactone decarboxylase